jgi:hypothetical protein
VKTSNILNKLLKVIFIVILIIGVLGPILFFVELRSMGRNFVHDRPASPAYYEHIQKRILFPAAFRGEKFDSMLNTFLQENPKYARHDSIGTGNFMHDSCLCDCLSFQKTVYFPDSPQEFYVITYDRGEMQGGIIDIVYQYRDSSWKCLESSWLDSLERVRIENRFKNEIIRRLK